MNKVIFSKKHQTFISEYDGYARPNFVEIESPYGKVSFKDFAFEPFDFVEEYSFLNNEMLLVLLV